MGPRKSRYQGTNRGTKGTVVNQTLLLLPRFPYKNIIIARYLDFRIEKKKKENRGTNCVESKRAHSQPGTYIGIYFVKIKNMTEGYFPTSYLGVVLTALITPKCC